MNFEKFYTLPILGILRGITSDQVVPIADASVQAGLQAIEITMNTDGAQDLISKMRNHCGNNMLVGAGTVTDFKTLKRAVDAGAQFIVMPIIDTSVLEYCNDNKIPVFPGALTPNEIYKAWQHGATMVKVFPSSVFGPSYFKEVKAPLNDIKLMACGGVSADTITAFFKNGASAAAFGISIFKKEWMETGNYSKISDEIKTLINAFKSGI